MMAKDGLKSPQKIASPKKKSTWSKSETRDGITEELKVKAVENGFIVCVRKYGSKGEKWIDEEKEYIAKENPLEEEEKESFSDMIDDILEDMAEQDGMIETK